MFQLRAHCRQVSPPNSARRQLAPNQLLHLLGGSARSAFDFRPPASIPLYRGNPWFMPAIIWGYRMQDWFALWRAHR